MFLLLPAQLTGSFRDDDGNLYGFKRRHATRQFTLIHTLFV